MAFIQANIYSNVLEMEVMVNVILPKLPSKGRYNYKNDQKNYQFYIYYMEWAVIIVSGERRTSIERYVSDYQMAVIMPSTDLAWYTDTTYDMKYWTFVAEELPQICRELFPQLSSDREKTFAAGLSMGAMVLLKLGLRKPESFAAVASLSGALAIAESMDSLLKIRNTSYWEGIFGPLDQFQGSRE